MPYTVSTTAQVETFHRQHHEGGVTSTSKGTPEILDHSLHRSNTLLGAMLDAFKAAEYWVRYSQVPEADRFHKGEITVTLRARQTD